MARVTLESIMDDMACLKPSLMDCEVVLPKANSSRTRSKIRMFASTAKPIVKTIPAIPGKVNTAPSEVSIPMMKNILAIKATFATIPERL